MEDIIGRVVTFDDGRKGRIDCLSHIKGGRRYYSVQMLKKRKGKYVGSGEYVVTTVRIPWRAME